MPVLIFTVRCGNVQGFGSSAFASVVSSVIVRCVSRPGGLPIGVTISLPACGIVVVAAWELASNHVVASSSFGRSGQPLIGIGTYSLGLCIMSLARRPKLIIYESLCITFTVSSDAKCVSPSPTLGIIVSTISLRFGGLVPVQSPRSPSQAGCPLSSPTQGRAISAAFAAAPSQEAACAIAPSRCLNRNGLSVDTLGDQKWGRKRYE